MITKLTTNTKNLEFFIVGVVSILIVVVTRRALALPRGQAGLKSAARKMFWLYFNVSPVSIRELRTSSAYVRTHELGGDTQA